MTKVFHNDEQRAIAYAVYKKLDAMIKIDGNLPPGNYDVSNQTVEITLPPKMFIERDPGVDGNGIVMKTATQNLYGFAVWAKMVSRLSKFKQWELIKAVIIQAMKESVTAGKSTENSLLQADKDLAKEIENLRKTLGTPKREEVTPRKVKGKLPLTIKFNSTKVA